MIKLIRPEKPAELCMNEEKLTEKYKLDGSDVWRRPYIVEALTDMSHNKCCFCETRLGEQGKNLQVEHFHCKSKYPDEVVKWENLLPACSQCNSNKGTHDTHEEPIINPAVDNPKDFLYLKFYRLCSKNNDLDSTGRLTIDLLDLNNRRRLVNPRLKIADQMHSTLENCLEKALDINCGQETRPKIKNKVKKIVTDLLMLAQPESEYSAFISTILLEDDDFKEICKILKKFDLWTDEIEFLYQSSEKIKLDIKK